MKDFNNQLAFITGGASGAGLGQAKVFGRAGARVCIADVRQEALDKAVAELRAEGIEAEGVQLDIMDRDAYARAADRVEELFGMAPTILSNTAGVNSFGPVEKLTYDDYDWIIGVCMDGVINGLVTFVPRMIASGKPGHIVTVASIGGFMGSAICAPYSAAKAAAISLMESYRQGLAEYDIGVSVCTPANINSNIANAPKLRPERFRDSGCVETAEAIQSLESIYQHGLDPVRLGEAIKDGIERNALYIIPYPETREGLAAHFDKIVQSVAPMDSDPEGARERVAALQNWAQERGDLFDNR